MTMCDHCIHHLKCRQPQWITIAVQAGDMYCKAFKPVPRPRISMSWTSPAWVSMNKTVTRRNWMPSTVKKFPKGKKFMAVSSNYGGDALGVGEITENPFKQSTKELDWPDYINEGFHYLDREFIRINHKDYSPLEDVMDTWRRKDELLTVVPFRVIEIFPGMMDKYTSDSEIKRCVKALVRVIG